jgi:hypothetical protein
MADKFTLTVSLNEHGTLAAKFRTGDRVMSLSYDKLAAFPGTATDCIAAADAQDVALAFDEARRANERDAHEHWAEWH